MSDPWIATSPIAGTVIEVAVDVADEVDTDAVLLVIESMKMEHPVHAGSAARVEGIEVGVGDTVAVGQTLVRLAPAVTGPTTVASSAASQPDAGSVPDAGPDQVRGDLRRLQERRQHIEDAARPDAVRARHDRGARTARENIAALVDPGSFAEYGGLNIAAQRRRRSVEELQATTPADGLIAGTATINADRFGRARSQCVVLAYDYTVLAGTQGQINHRKKDRMFALAEEHGLPVVLFAEGGGGRPGDTDALGASWLDTEAFQRFARLSGRVPTIAIVDGYCFAGNAALAGCADLIIATERSNLGMAGPAMIEGGGLGSFAPTQIGPIEVQRANGVVDVVVKDDAEAVEVARRYLGMVQGPTGPGEYAEQERLRTLIPEDRRQTYDVRAVLDVLVDTDSLLELRRDFAPGMVTGLARFDGRAVGILASDPRHLGGAIDADGADAAARLLQLCDVHGLPVVVLCDTPGFMVGPDAEAQGSVRHVSRMFVVGANLRVPLVAVITRKAYGLGAQAMLGGHLHVPVVTVAWPTAELGPMGLEGAVRLGYRRELAAIDDPAERDAREQQMIAEAYRDAHALNAASFGEIDDVIDPAATRGRVTAALDAATSGQVGEAVSRTRHRFLDPW